MNPAAPAKSPRTVAPSCRPVTGRQPGSVEPGLLELAFALAGASAGNRADLLLQRVGVVLVPANQISGAQRPDQSVPVLALLVVHSISPPIRGSRRQPPLSF